MCPSNIKSVPVVLKPAAWLLAETMRIFSPVEIRILSCAAILAVVFTVVRQVAGTRNPAAGFLVLSSFVGVAGAALIFVRYEFVFEVQLLSCLLVAARLKQQRVGVVGDVVAAIGLMLSAALSVWSHLQGLLLLPLAAYLLARLTFRRFGSIGALAGLLPFILFVPPALTLHHSVCTEHPEIEAHWRSMTLGGRGFDAGTVAQQLADGAHAYVGSFLYKSRFPINFLPGIEVNGFLAVTNVLVCTVVIVMTGLALITPFVSLWSQRVSKASTVKESAEGAALSNYDQVVVALLILAPVGFLYVYDTQHNFYRNFYINHFIAIAACLVLGSLSGHAAVRIARGGRWAISITVALSLASNVVLFIPPLVKGYEGPSLSVRRNWSQVTRNTEEAARLCKMDLSRGRIIVDDWTQAGLSTRPMTIPITYLALQARLVGISDYEAAIKVKANYAILRCPYFEALRVEPQGKVGEICCYTFAAE
jgi:hypothetical protein